MESPSVWAGARVVDINLFAVEVQRQAVGIGQHRPTRRWLRGHSLQHIVVRNDHRAQLCHRFIASRVVAVDVGVHHVADRLIADLGKRGHDLLVHGSVHRVHKKDPVATGRHQNVALRGASHQHEDAGRDLYRLDLLFRKVHTLPARAGEKCQQQRRGSHAF